MNRYSPSEAARRSGFSLDTLRYYEKIGLLEQIPRTAGGKRIFSDSDLGWLEILRCLRDTGMPIAQMCRYAELGRGGDDTVAERVELLQEHARRVQEHLDLTLRQQRHLHDKIAHHQRDLALRTAI